MYDGNKLQGIGKKIQNVLWVLGNKVDIHFYKKIRNIRQYWRVENMYVCMCVFA